MNSPMDCRRHAPVMYFEVLDNRAAEPRLGPSFLRSWAEAFKTRCCEKRKKLLMAPTALALRLTLRGFGASGIVLSSEALRRCRHVGYCKLTNPSLHASRVLDARKGNTRKSCSRRGRNQVCKGPGREGRPGGNRLSVVCHQVRSKPP